MAARSLSGRRRYASQKEVKPSSLQQGSKQNSCERGSSQQEWKPSFRQARKRRKSEEPQTGDRHWTLRSTPQGTEGTLAKVEFQSSVAIAERELGYIFSRRISPSPVCSSRGIPPPLIFPLRACSDLSSAVSIWNATFI